jgi:hypothetical protein
MKKTTSDASQSAAGRRVAQGQSGEGELSAGVAAE